MESHLYIVAPVTQGPAADVAVTLGDRSYNISLLLYAAALELFKSLCEECHKKRKRPVTKDVVRPILSKKFTSRVELIDMQSMPHSNFKWIMVYQNHLTKFCILRPLQTKRAVEVAFQLALELFKSLCEECHKKRKRPVTKDVVRPILSKKFTSRVELIDMQSMPHSNFKWIMVYQNHLTKFCILRPLQTKRAVEVAFQLVDIFLLMGAPT
ncbi:uncharacterized protein LOC134772370 [Penaeus indicus]|uniref:uncharacterized protein LOC134772370 n=1 Tax=Penaeus indicus TaxID=29960 RepID=UPI00300D53CF